MRRLENSPVATEFNLGTVGKGVGQNEVEMNEYEKGRRR
jgi:hypothetical protein